MQSIVLTLFFNLYVELCSPLLYYMQENMSPHHVLAMLRSTSAWEFIGKHAATCKEICKNTRKLHIDVQHEQKSRSIFKIGINSVEILLKL